MTRERASDPRTILLILGSAAGAMLALAICLALVRYSAEEADPLQAMIVAVSFGLVSVVSLPATYYGIRSLRGESAAPGRLGILSLRRALLFLLVWFVSLGGRLLAAQGGLLRWTAPLFHILSIALPVYVVVHVAAGGLVRMSRTGTWGLFTAGMWFGTGLAMVAEALLGMLALMIAVLYIVSRPNLIVPVQAFFGQLAAATDLQAVSHLLRPWLEHPAVILLALLVFAVLTPTIEEATKSLASWAILDRLQTTADGFAAGALAGAGFGLVESLFASAGADPYSTATLAVRAGSSMMHIAAGACAGIGIAAFHRTRAALALLRGYAAAVLIHGLWNASIVLVGFGAMRMGAEISVSDPGPVALILLGSATSVLLYVCAPIALAIANRRLRQGMFPPHSAVGAEAGITPGHPSDPSLRDR